MSTAAATPPPLPKRGWWARNKRYVALIIGLGALTVAGILLGAFDWASAMFGDDPILSPEEVADLGQPILPMPADEPDLDDPGESDVIQEDIVPMPAPAPMPTPEVVPRDDGPNPCQLPPTPERRSACAERLLRLARALTPHWHPAGAP